MSGLRIFVTGATGFLGRHLVNRLLGLGHAPTLAVRDRAACPPGWRSDARLKIVATGPLEGASGLDVSLADHHAVIHTAGLAHVAPADPAAAEAAFMRANAEATERLARAARHAGISRFVHVSSLSAITPNAAEAVVDDHTTGWRPETAYGRSKLAAEQALEAERGNMLGVSLRPPLIVGADAPGNWHSLQRLAASGLPLPFANVANRRSLVGADGLAEMIAVLCGAAWPAGSSGSYCVAEGKPASLRDMIAELRAGMGLPARLFAFPAPLMRSTLRLAGRQRQADGLFGDLVVDDSRFRRTFLAGRARDGEDLLGAIRRAGAGYVREAGTAGAGR
jgi:UDP-glucose 4-epimerase